MYTWITELYKKTKNAVVVDKYFGYAGDSNKFMQFVAKQNKSALLKEARRLEKKAKG